MAVVPGVYVRGSTGDYCREWTAHTGTYSYCRVPGRCVILVIYDWAKYRFFYKMAVVWMLLIEKVLVIPLQSEWHTLERNHATAE